MPAANPDLFWALKGGGGGSFGVVTRAHLARASAAGGFRRGEHDDQGRVADAAFRRLVGLIVDFYAEQPDRTRTGASRSAFGPTTCCSISMVFQGLTRGQAQAVWQPFLDAVDAARRRLQGRVLAAEDRLDVGARVLVADASSSARSASSAATIGPARRRRNVFWPGDQGQAGQFLHGYSSTWLPAALLQPARRAGAGRCALRGEPALGRLAAPQQGPRRRAGRRAAPRRATRRRTRPCSMPSRSRSSAPKSSRRIRASPATSPTPPRRACTRRRSRGRRPSCASSCRQPGSYVSESDYFEAGLAARVLGRELRAAAGGEGQVRPGRAVLRAPRRGQRAVERGRFRETELSP